MPTSTLYQLVCAAGDFQQRTAWVAARLSAQSVSPRGVYLRLLTQTSKDMTDD